MTDRSDGPPRDPFGDVQPTDKCFCGDGFVAHIDPKHDCKVFTSPRKCLNDLANTVADIVFALCQKRWRGERCDNR